jgi:hypothetical protein
MAMAVLDFLSIAVPHAQNYLSHFFIDVISSLKSVCRRQPYQIIIKGFMVPAEAAISHQWKKMRGLSGLERGKCPACNNITIL